MSDVDSHYSSNDEHNNIQNAKQHAANDKLRLAGNQRALCARVTSSAQQQVGPTAPPGNQNQTQKQQPSQAAAIPAIEAPSAAVNQQLPCSSSSSSSSGVAGPGNSTAAVATSSGAEEPTNGAAESTGEAAKKLQRPLSPSSSPESSSANFNVGAVSSAANQAPPQDARRLFTSSVQCK